MGTKRGAVYAPFLLNTGGREDLLPEWIQAPNASAGAHTRLVPKGGLDARKRILCRNAARSRVRTAAPVATTLVTMAAA